MKYTSRTLIALAALSPAVMALDVKDDDLKLGLKLQLQVRAEKSWAASRSGSAYSAAESASVAGSEADQVDFYIRRARIGFAGTWKGEYKFAYLLRNDNQDKATNSTASRTPQTHYAFIERIIKQEDLGIEHGIRAGLDYAWFNGTSAVFSSSSFLFPTERATGAMLAPRGTGVGYKLNSKMVQFGFDVQNNTGDSVAVASDGVTGGNEGLFYGTRLQIIPFDSAEKGHMKPVESFLGKDGTGVMISSEFGVNQFDNTSATNTTTTKGYGFELLAHANAITFLAEWRQTVANYDNQATPDRVNVATAYLFQIGYAIPWGDEVIEPAFRWTRLNSISQASESSEYGTSEFGGSGYSYDVGINYYLHGNSNKFQLAWQHWRSEGGTTNATLGGDGTLGAAQQGSNARADIVRAQWQISF